MEPEERFSDTPQFKHDCNECEFITHAFCHDVYVCPIKEFGKTRYVLLARYGNKGHEYASKRHAELMQELRPGHLIGDGATFVMPFAAWGFEKDRCDWLKAMILACALRSSFE